MHVTSNKTTPFCYKNEDCSNRGLIIKHLRDQEEVD